MRDRELEACGARVAGDGIGALFGAMRRCDVHVDPLSCAEAQWLAFELEAQAAHRGRERAGRDQLRFVASRCHRERTMGPGSRCVEAGAMRARSYTWDARMLHTTLIRFLVLSLAALVAPGCPARQAAL